MSGATRTSSDAVHQASVKTLWMVEVRESDLALTTRLVAWALATWMNSDGWCYPSVELITKATKLARRTVFKHLGILVDNGFLTRTRGGGLGHSSQYQGHLKGAPIDALNHPERVHPRTERVHLDDRKSARAGVQEVTKKYPLRRGSASPSPNGDSPPEELEGTPPPWADIGWEKYLTEERRRASEG